MTRSRYELEVRDGQDMVLRSAPLGEDDKAALRQWQAHATDEERAEGVLVTNWRNPQRDGSGEETQDEELLHHPEPEELSGRRRPAGARREQRRMLEALADVMEEERIPPNLRHLPMVEDTRPSIQIPIYGPLPISTQVISVVLFVFGSGITTSATAIYASIYMRPTSTPT
jgi:hypothetical protein|eukprot:COSAG01_NODE_263_length_19988_cov_19.806275_2_plen_171_part_00